MKNQFDSLIKKAMRIAILLFVIRCFISADEISHDISAYTILGYAGEAIGVAALIMIIYEKWLWIVDPFVKIPYIAGDYKGIIKSGHDEKIRSASLAIKQSLLSVEVEMKTCESTSRSVTGGIEDVLNRPELIYSYLNEPNADVRDRSAIHYGTATFLLDKKGLLKGRYYTDRNTTGDMEFNKVKKYG